MKIRLKPKPISGDKKRKTGFLFLPLRIDFEIRWLEKATWEEEYHENLSKYGYYHKWERIRWIDENENTTA